MFHLNWVQESVVQLFQAINHFITMSLVLTQQVKRLRYYMKYLSRPTQLALHPLYLQVRVLSLLRQLPRQIYVRCGLVQAVI